MNNGEPKILVVGSMAMDLTVTTAQFPKDGETVLGQSFSTAPGGKGANQAVAAARLGAKVTMIGALGNDNFGDTVIDSLNASGVNTEYIIRTEAFPTGIADIQLETRENGTENRICIVPGANMGISVEDIMFINDIINDYDMVMLQLEIPMEVNTAVAKIAHANNVPVMLNPAPYSKINDELLGAISYISPNEHEASLLCNTPIHTVEDAQHAISKFCKKHNIKTIITLGSKGAAYGYNEQFIFSPAVKNVRSVDPTAAGDSFVAAFCTAKASGLHTENSMEFANNVAAITVSRYGAQTSLPWLNEVENFKITYLGGK